MQGRTTVWLTVLALTLAAVSTGPAAAEEHDVEPVFVRTDVWFHHAGRAVGNVQGDPVGDAIPSWDTTKPTASQPLGAGAVYASNNYSWFTTQRGVTEPHDARSGPTFAGTHTGDLADMAVELYAYMPVNRVGVTRLPAAFAFDFRIDGAAILLQDETEPSYGILAEQITDEGLHRIRFVLTNVYAAMQQAGLDLGDDVEHEVYLNLTTFYAGTESVFVFDSAEAPAGAVFNLLDPVALRDYTKVDVFNPPPPYSGGLPAAPLAR